MAVHYRTLGFILKKEDRGEADQLFTIFTKDFGKLEILGKAIRKIKSKLRCGAELFYFSEIEFIQGKTHKTLTDAILIKKFENIKKDLEKIKIAHKITDVVDGLVGGQEKDENIFNLLNEAFNKLNNFQFPRTPRGGLSGGLLSNFQLIYYYSVWNLLSILGYQIDLYHCVKCQEKLIPGLMNFSSESNGIICLKCSDDNTKDKVLISPEIIKIVRLFLKKDWKTLSRLKMEETYQKSLKLISESYLADYKKEKKS